MRYRFNIVDLITLNALVALGLTVLIGPREIRETFLSVAIDRQESNVRGSGSSEAWNKFRRNV